MADSVLVLRLHANAKRIAIMRYVARLLQRVRHADVAVGMVDFISIDDAVLNLLADFFKCAWIDAVSREVSEGVCIIKYFARPSIEVLPQFGVLGKINRCRELLGELFRIDLK